VNGWLLDTNVVSEMRKLNCAVEVELWIDAQPRNTLFLSPVSMAEFRFGIERALSDERRRELARWLDADVRQWFAGRIVRKADVLYLDGQPSPCCSPAG
jgi:hypothetical protein